MRETILTRHLAACIHDTEACWPYPGYCNTRTRYGNATVDGRRVEAHRGAYELLIGPIPIGLEFDHLCRNRPCCNPWHLEPVVHRTNVLRGASPMARQARQAACVHGHPLEGGNLWIDRRGRRHCVACRRRRSREKYYRSIGKPVPGPVRPDYRTHCKRGHPKSGANLYVARDGTRQCRACHHYWRQEYKKRRGFGHDTPAANAGASRP